MGLRVGGERVGVECNKILLLEGKGRVAKSEQAGPEAKRSRR